MPEKTVHDPNFYRKQAILELELEGRIGPGAAELQKRIEEIRNRYVDFSGKVKNLQAELDKQSQIMSKVAAGVGQVTSAVSKFGSVFGATSLSIGAALQNLNKYNTELRTSAAQFVKYGQGISQTKAQVESLAETFKLTRQQTIELMSSFESGFDFADLKAMPGLFDKISDSVGGSKEAMAGMLQALQGIAGKSTQFSQILMSSFSGSKKGSADAIKDIQAAGMALIASGKIGVAEAKKLDEFVSGGKTLSKEDQAQKELLDEQMRFFRSMNKLFEDISMHLGGKMMPIVKAIGDTILKIKDVIIPVVSYTIMIGTAIGGLASVVHSFGKLSLYLQQISEMSAGAIKGGTSAGAGAAAGGAARVGSWYAGTAGTSIAAAPISAGIAIAGSAAAGFGAGNLMARGIGAGIYGWADQADKVAESYDPSSGKTRLQQLQIQKAKKETEIDADRIKGQWYTFGASADWNPFSNKYGSGRKRTNEEQGELNRLDYEINLEKKKSEEVAKQEEQQRKIEQAEKDRLAPLVKYALEMARINEILDMQNSKLQAQTGLMEGILQLSGMNRAGGGVEGQESISSSRDELYAQADMLQTALEVTKRDLEIAKNQLGNAGPEAMQEYLKITQTMPVGSKEREKAEEDFARKTGIRIGGETRLLELQKQIKENETARIKIGGEAIKIKSQGLEQVQLETSLLESQMNLANSYGFGLKATVQMQMQVVQSLTEQKSLMRGQLEDLNTQKEQALSKARSQSEKDKIEFYYRNEILKKQNEITEATRKQADITKSLREGYISAIAAMTTGAGVFNRIVITQDRRLGSLVFGAPNKIRALRAGSELEGRRESGRFGAGNLTEGAAGEAEKAVLSQFGDFITAGDVRKGAEAVTNKVEQFKGSAAAALSDNLYGSSQAFDEHKKAADNATSSLTKLSTVVNTIFGSFVDPNGKVKGATSGSSSINDIIKNSDEVKRVFIDTLKSVNSPEVINAFKQAMADVATAAAREAVPMVLRELRQAQ